MILAGLSVIHSAGHTDNLKVATGFFPFELLFGRKCTGALQDGPSTNKKDVH